MSGVSITLSNFQPTLETAFRSLGLSPEQINTANDRALTAMGAWMFREMRSALEPTGAQGQPGSNKKWKPLSEAWIALKASEGRPTHIGIHEGMMQNSISTDKRLSQLQVETGPTVEHAEGFDKVRPITPKEDYALSYMAEAMIDALGKVAR